MLDQPGDSNQMEISSLRAELRPPSPQLSPAGYVRKVAGLRHFILADARGRLRSGHADPRLGLLWLYLEPLIETAIYFVVFGTALRSGEPVNGVDFLAYLFVGRVVYSAAQRALVRGATSLTGHFVIAADFPHAALPMSGVVQSALLMRYEVVILAWFLLVRQTGLRWQFVLLVPFLVLFGIFVAGASLLVARASFEVPDLKLAINQVLRLAFFASGIIFPIEETLDGGLEVAYTWANPFFAFVKLAQRLILGYDSIDPGTLWLVCAVWAAATGIGGALWFIAGEQRYRTPNGN